MNVGSSWCLRSTTLEMQKIRANIGFAILLHPTNLNRQMQRQYAARRK
ncbi:MAG: hypothetical protein ACJAZW_001344 [Maritalea sp.]|jgi:hypothetical protein